MVRHCNSKSSLLPFSWAAWWMASQRSELTTSTAYRVRQASLNSSAPLPESHTGRCVRTDFRNSPADCSPVSKTHAMNLVSRLTVIRREDLPNAVKRSSHPSTLSPSFHLSFTTNSGKVHFRNGLHFGEEEFWIFTVVRKA